MNNTKQDFTILVVDDVATNVMLVQAILRKEGYSILTTDSGAKALRIVSEKHPNLILLDIMMPEMDGYEVLQHLKGNPDTKDIPVIIMSALSDMQSIVKGYQLGALEYVTKPFQRDELVKRVSHRYELFSVNLIKEELESTIKSRDTLYSVIAHDLRSPIGSLKMMNNAILMMVDKRQVSTEVLEMLQMMNKTTEELFLLLDNLLKWVRNRLNRQSIDIKKNNITGLVNSVIDIMKPIAVQKNITIKRVELDAELIGSVDADMFSTVARNIISNAIKFTRKDGLVEVSVETKDNFVILKVKDNGVGIKAEDQPKLLKEDTHFTSYGTNNEKGSGLGLMLCKDFVEMHNGKIWFESIDQQGTTFFASFKALNQE